MLKDFLTSLKNLRRLENRGCIKEERKNIKITAKDSHSTHPIVSQCFAHTFLITKCNLMLFTTSPSVPKCLFRVQMLCATI